jgi:hypothetical protein
MTDAASLMRATTPGVAFLPGHIVDLLEFRDVPPGTERGCRGGMSNFALAGARLALVLAVASGGPRAFAQRNVHVLGPETMETHHGSYEGVVNAVRSDMRLDVTGRPTAGGRPYFEASYQKLVIRTESARASTLRAGSYTPVDQPHQVRISGVPGGLLRVTHLGTTSAHDLGGNRSAIDARAASDLVRISVAHGSGPERVLVDRGQAGHVSLHDLEIPLALGMPTRVIYEHLDSRGNVAGGRYGYQSGRVLELHWDGQ